MAIGPVGNAVYVHQNMHVAASKQTDLLNRFDLQNVMAAEILKDKEKEVTQVRPAEETHAVDPEGHKDETPQEEKKKPLPENQEKKPLEVHSDTPKLHILDIKV